MILLIENWFDLIDKGWFYILKMNLIIKRNKNDSNKDENNENYINKKCSFVTNPKINKIRTMV